MTATRPRRARGQRAREARGVPGKRGALTLVLGRWALIPDGKPNWLKLISEERAIEYARGHVDVPAGHKLASLHIEAVFVYPESPR